MVVSSVEQSQSQSQSQSQCQSQPSQSPELSLDPDFSMKSSQRDGQGYIERKRQGQIEEACLWVAIVGIGYLFPFSALTQPVDYWNVLFPDFNIEFSLTCLYMWTNLIVLASLVFFGRNHSHHQPSGTQESTLASTATSFFTKRIVGGFIGQFLILIVVPSSYFLHLSEHWNVIFVLGSTMVVAAVTAYIDSAVISLVSQYPLRVQEYFQLGVGLSTLIGSIYRDVTKIVFAAEAIIASSLMYFYSGALTIGICIVAYIRLMHLPLTQESLSHPVPMPVSSIRERVPLLFSNQEEAEEEDKENKMAEFNHQYNDNDDDSNNVGNVDRYRVLRKVLYNEFMVFTLFCSTLALWPALITEIPSYRFLNENHDDENNEGTWWSLILLTVFSIMDCIGRLLVRYRLGLTKDTIWLAVMIRFFILFPTLLGQVQGGRPYEDTTASPTSTLTVVTYGSFFLWFGIPSDVWSAILVGLLGVTNGYIGTLTIVMVNDACDTPQEQAVAGTFTSFFLNSGLVIGATFGMIFDSLLLSNSSMEN